MSGYGGDNIRTFAWAIDFLRAYYERPFICKILARVIFGKYAYREFIGLIHSFVDEGTPIDFGYSFTNADYMGDKVPLVWWKIESEK